MANVTYTVPNKNGSYDGDMVVKQYTSLTINTGDTITVDQPCRGLMILVQGNCVINGTLSMKSKGALANPTTSGANDSAAVSSSGLRFPFATSGGSSSISSASSLLDGCGTAAKNVIANFPSLTSNGNVLTISRGGATGGSQIYFPSANTGGFGNSGNNGSTGQSGGGGGGSVGYAGTGYAGASGTCFAGGPGGGSQNNNGSGASAGTDYGGAGGSSSTGHNASVSGGAGNPRGGRVFGGTAESGYGASWVNGTNGCGGTIILIVGGNLTIGASGTITAAGGDADGILHTTSQEWATTSGGSGGGNILIAVRGTYTNNGTVTAAGGNAGIFYYPNLSTVYMRKSPLIDPVGAGNYYKSSVGGQGGNGSVQVLQVL